MSLGFSLAAADAFLHCQATNALFDPTPAHVALWRRQGEQLAGAPTLYALLARVSAAWPLEVAADGGAAVAVSEHSGNVVVFADTARPMVLGAADGALREYDAQQCPEHALVFLRRRAPLVPRVFPQQHAAFAAADALPANMLMVWARDCAGAAGAAGAKEYLVASLDDFWAHYSQLAPAQRNHYEVIRSARRVCFVADLEYALDVEDNRRQHDPQAMVAAFKALVEQQWLADTGVALNPRHWVLYEACSAAKVSFHAMHPGAAFRDLKTAHGAFCARLTHAAPPSLFVSARAWNPRTQQHEVAPRFFADLSIYSNNRVFRMAYSTKAQQQRPMLPMAGAQMVCERWECGLVTLERPDATLHPHVPAMIAAPAPAAPAAPAMVAAPVPALIAALAREVERHFGPERMREHTLDDRGICTFSMVLHDCREICRDQHNNQVYVVADLKRRVYYAKCHADRSKTGPEHPFPASVHALTLVEDVLVPGGVQSVWTLPAASASATFALRFLRAVFGSANGGVAGRIPAPGSVALVYNSADRQYEIALGTCDNDGGALELTLCDTGACIRCVGGGRCSKQGWRLERPSRSSAHGWDLSFLLPAAAVAAAAAPAVAAMALQPAQLAVAAASPAQAFLAEGNFFKALGFAVGDNGDAMLYADRLDIVAQWARDAQRNAPASDRNASGVHVVAAQVARKCGLVRAILLDAEMEVVYRECLTIAPDFRYPDLLVPKGPRTLLVALWVHLARAKGYKRVGDHFYVPTADGERFCYVAVPLDQMLTRLCTFGDMPNLCTHLWSLRNSGDMEHMLRDENHWPSLPLSKRYLGFRNAVYDLEANAALTWAQARDDPSVMPFNCLNTEFPLDALQQAIAQCPAVRIAPTADGILWEGALGVRAFVRTPLFDQPLLDQGFDDTTVGWFYLFMGRMFHRVGKGAGGDNWEIVPACQGAPGTFKSSLVTILQSYLQPTQFGVIATKTEQRFPIAALAGKLMVFLTEMADCDLDKELFKQMASGDPVTVATKFHTAAIVPNWDVPMWFLGNAFLALLDTDGSVERRFALSAFSRQLRAGQGDVTLTARIIAQEQATLLIKCNTLYLAAKQAIRQPVHQLLPPLMREATSQAIMQSDSLRCYLVQNHVVVARDPATPPPRIPWNDMWRGYVTWCQQHGLRPQRADPNSPAMLFLVHRLGARLHTHKGVLWLMCIRLRDPALDPPFRSVFEPCLVARRANANADDANADDADADDDDDQMHDSLSWRSDDDDDN